MAYRTIAVKVEVAWDGSTWVDETDRMIRISGAREKVPPFRSALGSRSIIQRVTVVLQNEDNRFSFYNSSSPIYANIKDGAYYLKPIRISVTVDGSTTRLFTGVLKKMEENFVQGTVTLTLSDALEKAKRRFSTAVLQNYREHELITYYLTLAGFVDGTDFKSPTWVDSNGGTATIDYSAKVIPYSWLDDEDVRSEIDQVAQATGAQLYVDNDGLIHYEKHWQYAMPGSTLEVHTLSSASEIKPKQDDLDFAEEIVVEYATRVPGAPGEELWALPATLIIYPGQTEKITARYRWPALSVDTPVNGTHYRLTTPAGSEDLSSSCTVSVTTYAQSADIQITNGTSDRVCVVPYFRLVGTPLLGQPAEQYRANTGTVNFGRRKEIRGNFYVQTKSQAQCFTRQLKRPSPSPVWPGPPPGRSGAGSR